MFAVDNIADIVARMQAHGADLVGEVADYEDVYRLCYSVAPTASSSRSPKNSAKPTPSTCPEGARNDRCIHPSATSATESAGSV
jgi:hypothetical protein